MKEGWYGDEYLILFEESEISSASERYSISQFLPGYVVIGFRSWDDFLVRDQAGAIYLVPTLPLTRDNLSPYPPPKEPIALQSDTRFEGKLKWYVKPIAFGGDAKLGENITWISHEEHSQLVRWWNEQCRTIKRR